MPISSTGIFARNRIHINILRYLLQQ